MDNGWLFQACANFVRVWGYKYDVDRSTSFRGSKTSLAYSASKIAKKVEVTEVKTSLYSLSILQLWILATSNKR